MNNYLIYKSVLEERIKTLLRVDFINRFKTVLFCYYVVIGQKQSTIAAMYAILKRYKALGSTIIFNSSTASSPVSQYLIPYYACSFGEFFRDLGLQGVAIYDDLSTHANAFRQLSLLLRRAPGREAYPGDVFYLHSRLLERASKLSETLSSGGSLTALPIIETQAGDISAYIVTNAISITDGQLFLDSELFFRGIRPAIHVGLSVSRVGSKAQHKFIKNLAGQLKLNLALFREVEVLAQFGSSTLGEDEAFTLKRGYRLVEILKQTRFKPISFEFQLFSIYLGMSGFFDMISVDRVSSRLSFFLNYFMLLTHLHENPYSLSMDS